MDLIDTRQGCRADPINVQPRRAGTGEDRIERKVAGSESSDRRAYGIRDRDNDETRLSIAGTSHRLIDKRAYVKTAHLQSPLQKDARLRGDGIVGLAAAWRER